MIAESVFMVIAFVISLLLIKVFMGDE